MLKFMRNKIVGVEHKEDDQTLIARGTLTDDMYAMRLEVTARLDDLVITDIIGHLDRYTTPECPHANRFLREAVGLRIDSEEFGRQVHRTIWRRSCQHYASLLEDCGEGLRQAALMLENKPQKAPSRPSAVPGSDSKPDPAHKRPQPKRGGGGQGFVVDLHVHTAPASPCASDTIEEIIVAAKKVGLDAICLTDHNTVWDAAAVDALKARHDFMIFRGNEITTDQGDILVFGLDKQIDEIIALSELRDLVSEVGGVMVAAHPFRGFLTFGVGQLGLTVEKALMRPVFQLVDGLEIRNGKVTDEENRFAEEVATALGLPAVGGSDAHKASQVGCYATRFFESLGNENDLIGALRSGRFEVMDWREDKKEGEK